MRSCGMVAAAVVALALAVQPAGGAPRTEVLGRSVEDRPLVATVVAAPEARRVVLVVGCVHGNECAALPVVRWLAAGPSVAGTELWLVGALNPDGRAHGTRQNARGVDLNRNFPAGWRASGRPWDPEYPGPRPLSEPEARATVRLVGRIRPHVTIWFHQPQAVVRAWGPSVAAARRYARLSGLPFRRLRWPPGAVTRWQNTRFPGTASFVVELAAGPLSRAAVARHAAAVRALAAGR
jgi:protein MpaA